MVGTKDEVAARIQELADDLGVQEVAVVTWTHDETVRRHSYTLLAQAFGLTPVAEDISEVAS